MSFIKDSGTPWLVDLRGRIHLDHVKIVNTKIIIYRFYKYKYKGNPFKDW